MSGRAAAYDALFARYGVATVTTPAEMLETLKLLDNGGRLGGTRIVSMSCSGGEASLVADRTERGTLRFDRSRPTTRHRIESTLTELVTVSNPFDYHTFMWGDRAATSKTLHGGDGRPAGHHHARARRAARAPTTIPSSWIVSADALADAAEATGGRAVIVATMAECLNETLRTHISASGC